MNELFKLYNSKIWILNKELIEKVITVNHNHLLIKYPRIRKTIQRIKETYNILRLR